MKTWSNSLPIASFFLFYAAACSLTSLSRYEPSEDGTTDPDGDGRDMDVTGDDGSPPVTCGNGIVEEGEECDDGNLTSGDGCDFDCTFTCSSDGECDDGNPCNGEETCMLDTHTCTAGAPVEDGFVCGSDPRRICLSGDCVASVCGDGFVDTGAGEFCDPPGGTCLDDCTLGCTNDADCPDDGNPCNGLEFCNLEAGVCSRTAALADGDVCGESPRQICISGTCQNSICGDGFVDGGRTPPEQCDDGNAVPDDGCENDCTFTCERSQDCLDDNVCNGMETCDMGTHTCVDGEPLPAGAECDDGLFCTAVDTCSASHLCTGTGDPCDDERDCTVDTCDESANSCGHAVVEGACLISGVCYDDGDPSPTNPCRGCVTSVSHTAWTTFPDMTVCAGSDGTAGVCCGGTCRVGGNCCTDADCGTGCEGDAVPCSIIGDGAICNLQTGCSWVSTVEPECLGDRSCWEITGLDASTCRACGCDGAMYYSGEWHCTDTSGTGPSPCSGYVEPLLCLVCACESHWPGTCSGTHPACDTYATEDECWTQFECWWTEGLCQSYQCR
jgi:cysteine-rich repeat protein